MTVESSKETIQSYISTFLKSKVSLDSCSRLITDSVPHLVYIKGKLGVASPDYLHLSTALSETLINGVEKSIAEAKRKFNSSSMSNESINAYLNSFVKAYELYLSIGWLDKDESFEKKRYAVGKRNVYSVITKFKQTDRISPIILDMRTDNNVFRSCHNVDDYQYYVQKFPEGDHVREANDMILRLQEEERQQVNDEKALWDECLRKNRYRKYLKVYGEDGAHSDEAEERWNGQKQKLKKNIKLLAIAAFILAAAIYGLVTSFSNMFLLLGYLTIMFAFIWGFIFAYLRDDDRAYLKTVGIAATGVLFILIGKVLE